MKSYFYQDGKYYVSEDDDITELTKEEYGQQVSMLLGFNIKEKNDGLLSDMQYEDVRTFELSEEENQMVTEKIEQAEKDIEAYYVSNGVPKIDKYYACEYSSFEGLDEATIDAIKEYRNKVNVSNATVGVTFKATVTLLSTGDGGRRQPIYSGYKPNLLFKRDSVDNNVDCWMTFDKENLFPSETETVVITTTRNLAFEVNETFILREGQIVVGYGVILEFDNFHE